MHPLRDPRFLGFAGLVLLLVVALLAQGTVRLGPWADAAPQFRRRTSTVVARWLGVAVLFGSTAFAALAHLTVALPDFFLRKAKWFRAIVDAIGHLGIGAAYAVAVPLWAGLVTWSALRGRERAASSVLAWLGGYAGLATIALAALGFQGRELRPSRMAQFRPDQELALAGAILLSMLFVLAVLATLTPFVLDRIERRGFASFVGVRHVRATKSGFLTVISVLSILGVGLSSCALCSVTSIMGGFGHDLKGKILANYGHAIVDAPLPGGFGDWEDKLDRVRLAVAPKDGAATPVVAGEAMGSSATNTAGVLLRGIDPDTIGQVIELPRNLEAGKFEYLSDPGKLVELPPDETIGLGPTGERYRKGPDFRGAGVDPSIAQFLKAQTKEYPGILLGKELAKSLHVLVGDEVTLLSPQGDLGPTGVLPRSRKFRVAGIFYSGMYEYDATHAYVLLEQAQTFFNLQGKISQIDVRVPDPERIAEVRPALDALLVAFNDEERAAAAEAPVPEGAKPKAPVEMRVRDWTEMNKNLFSALKLEKIATFIILSIAIAVASFCIVCTLLLMVTEKEKEIAILKALGASDGSIMRTFMLEGVVIGCIGTLFGVLQALAACSGLSWSGVRLDPDVYYIDRLPVNVNGYDYLMVALAAVAICTLATLYPAYAASKLSPVDGLRYE